MCIIGDVHNYQVEVYNFSGENRYRKYLELRDMWEMEQGGGTEENSLSSYFINNYHRYLTFHPFYFQQQFLGTGAILGAPRTPLVSGAYASAKTQT